MILAVFCSAALAFATDFDSTSPSVRVFGGTATVEKGAGVGGSTALVCRKTQTNEMLMASFPVPELRPGMTARIVGKLRSVGVTNGVASLLLESYTKKGAYACGAAVAQRIAVGDGWDRIELSLSRPLPGKAVCSRLEVHMAPPVTGTAILDDVSVTVTSVLTNAVGTTGLSACSAYRETAASGPVTFGEQFSIDPEQTPVETLDARFSYLNAAGERVVRAADRVTEEFAHLTIDVADLRMGRQEIGFELRDGKGRVLGTDTERIPFTRVAKEPAYKVYFDRYGRCIVDGRPFFPIGMYWNDDHRRGKTFFARYEAYLDRYASGPFNMMTSYSNVIPRKEIDDFWKRGIRVVLSLAAYYCPELHDHPWRSRPQGLEKPEDEQPFVTRRVNEMKGHPALLAWYMADEPGEKYIPRLHGRYELLKRLDPDHPQISCHCDSRGTGKFVRCFDAMGVDAYPVCYRGCSEEEAKPDHGRVWGASEGGLACRERTYGCKPLWHVPQAFAWKWDYKDQPRCRFPTRNELRNMTWQLVAHGANALTYYSYAAMWADWGTPEFEKNWDAVCFGASEVKKHSEVLLKLPGPTLIPPKASVVVRTWKDETALYVLLVNSRHDLVKGEVALPFVPTKSEELIAGGVRRADGKLVLEMSDMAVSLLKLTR